jgi:hypothetical protein
MTREMPQMGAFEKEMPPINIPQEEKAQDLGVLMDFIDEKYFESFLNKLDVIEEENKNKPEAERVDITAVGKLLGIDIAKMRHYIDVKIPDLVEKINEMVNKENVAVFSESSMRDVLGNSIITIFNRILWVLENYHNPDPVVQEKISNPESNTRKIINLYVRNEVQSGLASYYIDNLCNDDEKLKMEIGTREGFLKNYQEYFQDINVNGQITIYYPSGGNKLAYFKFFNELELGKVNTGNIEDMLSGLDERVVNMDKIRKSEKVRQVQ